MNDNKERMLEHLDKVVFEDGKRMLSPEINSCDFHKINHQDTEILGMFCDKINIHGEDLKRVLLFGYLEYMSNQKHNEVDVLID